MRKPQESTPKNTLDAADALSDKMMQVLDKDGTPPAVALAAMSMALIKVGVAIDLKPITLATKFMAMLELFTGDDDDTGSAGQESRH